MLVQCGLFREVGRLYSTEGELSDDLRRHVSRTSCTRASVVTTGAHERIVGGIVLAKSRMKISLAEGVMSGPLDGEGMTVSPVENSRVPTVSRLAEGPIYLSSPNAD